MPELFGAYLTYTLRRHVPLARRESPDASAGTDKGAERFEAARIVRFAELGDATAKSACVIVPEGGTREVGGPALPLRSFLGAFPLTQGHWDSRAMYR